MSSCITFHLDVDIALDTAREINLVRPETFLCKVVVQSSRHFLRRWWPLSLLTLTRGQAIGLGDDVHLRFGLFLFVGRGP